VTKNDSSRGALDPKTQKETPPPPPAPPPEDDHVTRRVPVGKSPVRGKPTALVTIVEFAEFQCPFSGRVAPTLNKLEAEYGDKIRLVYKHNPLPNHPRAEPAAELALEARAQKGDKGFWAAHDLLFGKECIGKAGAIERQACMDAGGTFIDHQIRLEDADLLDYAKTLGLDLARVTAAIATKKYAAVIQEDMDLADDVTAKGTPTFFINGHKLVGAHPIEKFRALIDAELAIAGDLVKKGVATTRVYDKLQEEAKGPELERKAVPPPTPANPSRGPAKAKVVVQMFADFQCPYCKKSWSTVAELEKAFPGKIRVVWRNLPLPFHKEAPLAAEAAMEAFRQKGNAGFWAMADALFANDAPGSLERASLDAAAGRVGLDMTKFASALDASAHKDEIDADAKLAAAASITGTPTFLINGYVVLGAQPLARFRKVVEHALAEAK
jgi:protein-disulfide isomerase